MDQNSVVKIEFQPGAVIIDLGDASALHPEGGIAGRYRISYNDLMVLVSNKRGGGVIISEIRQKIINAAQAENFFDEIREI